MKLISCDPIDMEESYVIQNILQHRGEGPSREYLVQWKGYPKPENNTWESFSNFNDIAAIENYWKKQHKKNIKK